MNANHVLALERDMTTLVHLSQYAKGLLTDTTPMPDAAGTVSSRTKAVLLGFLPGFRNFMVALEEADPAAAGQVIAGFEALEDQEQPSEAAGGPTGDAAGMEQPKAADTSDTLLEVTHNPEPIETTGDLRREQAERRRLLGM